MTSEFTPNSDNQNDLASPMTVDGILRNVYGENSGEISLIDAAGAISSGDHGPSIRRTADEVWREIVAGSKSERSECKADEMMTLEDFLAKAGTGTGEEEEEEVEDIKVTLSGPPILSQRLSSGGGLFASFDPLVQNPNPYPSLHTAMGEGGLMGFANGGGEREMVVGRGKRRGGPMMETLDKAAQQRQRRMIKNRESAARSRERKQAYQVELESLALKLEEENEQLLREKVERTKERYKQLMEKVVPVVEKRRPRRTLRRVHSMQW